MADTAAQLRRVVARLRARGFTVHEVPGWTTRGTSAMTTRGRVEHHTATPRSARGDAPTLRVVTYGHGSLRNSLSRWYVSRSGVIYLIALRTSWHAGAGGKGTNTTLSGTEAEHSGVASEPWGARSLEAQAAISQEEAREFGFPTGRVWEHKEHAPSRKVDRTGISGNSWRQRLAHGTPAPTPAAPASPPAPRTVLERIAAMSDTQLAAFADQCGQRAAHHVARLEPSSGGSDLIGAVGNASSHARNASAAAREAAAAIEELAESRNWGNDAQATRLALRALLPAVGVLVEVVTRMAAAEDVEIPELGRIRTSLEVLHDVPDAHRPQTV